MRKLISFVDTNGLSLPPSLPPSPPPFGDLHNHPLFFFPPIPVADSAFDFATLSLISGLLLLSLLSFSFILHLRLKSRKSYLLQNFNNLWTVRLLLVSFISLWALNEILRLPFFRRRYLYPFLPSLTLNQQANLCKIHVVLSLGFFEPGFLVTLLFLVNVSIKKRNLHPISAIAFLSITCFPILVLQTFFVFVSPFEVQLPAIMHRSSVLSEDDFGNKTVMCTYPLFSGIVFAAFGIAYSLGLLLSCWRVVSFVINKGTRERINMLAFTVMTVVTLQIIFIGLSSLWLPENYAYGCVVFAMFLCVSLCGAVGEAILVIKPITDALAVGGDCCRWIPGIRLRSEDDDGKRVVDRTQ